MRISKIVFYGFLPLVCLIDVQLAHAAPDAHSANQPSPRYKLVAGMGYTVCERYVRLLNALPENESN